MKTIMLLSILLLFGCASKFGRKVENRFPSKSELVKLKSSTTTSTYLEDRTPGKRVETWKLTGPLPTQIGESTAVASNPFETLLAQNLGSNPSVNMTDSMNCAAREIAIFQSKYNAPPFQSLKRFITSRCGSITPNTNTITFDGGKATEAQALATLEPQLKQYVDQFSGFSGRVNMGIAFATSDARSTVIISYEQPSVKIKPTSINVPSGTFVIEGVIEDKKVPERFAARFTKGEFDTGKCLAQPVDSPAFKFVCRLDTTDESAYLQISSQNKDDLFATYVARILLFPGLATTTNAEGVQTPSLYNVYTPPTTRRILNASTKNIKQNTTLETVNELINRVRSSAGRPPIEGHVAQSESIQSLTPVFFESMNDSQKMNKTVLGMMAGWEINDEIVNADFSSNYVDSEDPAEVIEAFLETPGGRKTLLDKSASAFGFGTLSKPGSGMGAIFVSYNFVTNEHSNKRIKRVVAALNQERKAHGMKPIKENRTTRARAEGWAKELEKGALIEDIAQELMQAYLDETGKQNVHSYMMLVPNLDDISFDATLVNKRTLKPSFVVAPYKPLNSPWTFYAIIIAY